MGSMRWWRRGDKAKIRHDVLCFTHVQRMYDVSWVERSVCNCDRDLGRAQDDCRRSSECTCQLASDSRLLVVRRELPTRSY